LAPSSNQHGIQVTRRPVEEVLPDLLDYLDCLKAAGEGLPGRSGRDGIVEIDWPHLVRLFRSGTETFPRSRRGCFR
jgi:hypothetical protein